MQKNTMKRIILHNLRPTLANAKVKLKFYINIRLIINLTDNEIYKFKTEGIDSVTT